MFVRRIENTVHELNIADSGSYKATDPFHNLLRITETILVPFDQRISAVHTGMGASPFRLDPRGAHASLISPHVHPSRVVGCLIP
jgi:hypothetical protein